MELMKNFQPYKTRILNLLFEGEPIKSRDAYEHCVFHMNENHPCRASVIKFLQLLENSQYLTTETTSGKGGWHPIYSLAMPKENIMRKMLTDLEAEFIDKVLSGLN